VFLTIYVYEMEVHWVSKDQMIQTFGLAMVPKIYKKVQEIWGNACMTLWPQFGKRLRDEYFDDHGHGKDGLEVFSWLGRAIAWRQYGPKWVVVRVWKEV